MPTSPLAASALRVQEKKLRRVAAMSVSLKGVVLILLLGILGHVRTSANPARFDRLPGQKDRNADRDVPRPAQQGNGDPGLWCKAKQRAQGGIARFLNPHRRRNKDGGASERFQQ